MQARCCKGKAQHPGVLRGPSSISTKPAVPMAEGGDETIKFIGSTVAMPQRAMLLAYQGHPS